ncbi:MAG: DUF4230 domain-containing protein [Verrucomicrobiota bacterium]|jgi:Protein of unknown function (DUF4230)
MWRAIKFYFVSAVIIGLAGLAVYYRYFPQQPTSQTTVAAPAILRQIQLLNDLVTVRYNIQKVIGLKEQKVPFGNEQVLMLVQAKVLGGVNLASATASQTGKAVLIRLPPASIIDVSLDDTETKVWDRSKTWWTPWVRLNPDLEQSARRAALEDVRQAAVQMGILSNAQQNAETIIRNFLQTIGFNQVSVVITPVDRRN